MLGLEFGASIEAVKSQYQKLAEAFHPNKTVLPKKYASLYRKLIQEAYDTLGDPDKKAVFDEKYAEESSVPEPARKLDGEVFPAEVAACFQSGSKQPIDASLYQATRSLHHELRCRETSGQNLAEYVAKGDFASAKSLCDSGLFFKWSVVDRHGRTPLHLALYANADLRAQPETKTNTERLECIRAIAKLLIKAGGGSGGLLAGIFAPRNILDYQDSTGKTALHLAAEQGDREMALLLISSQASLNIQDNNGDAPLHSAILNRVHKSDGCVASALYRYRCRLDMQNKQGKTPLHLIIERGYSDLFTWFIRQGININLQDSAGQTVLHLLCARGAYKSVRIALHCGAKQDIKDDTGETPLHKLAKRDDLPEGWRAEIDQYMHHLSQQAECSDQSACAAQP